MLRKFEYKVNEEIQGVTNDVKQEALSLLCRHIESELDNHTHIDDIEEQLDSLQSVEFKLCGYKHLLRLLCRRLFSYEVEFK